MALEIAPYFRLPLFFYRLLSRLGEAALKVYLCIGRHTLGWHRESAPLAASLIAAETGLAESSVRRAIPQLVELGLIELVGEAGGGRQSNVYRLVVRARRDPSPPTVRGLPSHDAPHVKKKYQRKLEKKHHPPAALTVSFEAATPPPPPIPAPAPPATPDDASFKSKAEVRILPPERKAAMEALLGIGVHPGMARRLSLTRPPEVICRTLEWLPHRQVNNPAAFAVQEILDGGYAPPARLVASQKREQARSRRRAEEEAEERRREREDQVFRQRARALLGGLTPAEKESLLAEARRRVGSWARRRPELLEADSPVMLATMLDILTERQVSPPARLAGDGPGTATKLRQDEQNHTEPSRGPLNAFKFAGRGWGHPDPRKWPEGALEARETQPLVPSAFA